MYFPSGETFGDLAQAIIDAAPIDTGYGKLDVTGQTGGVFTYSYTLDERVDNDSQSGATDTAYDETFDVSVVDSASASSSTTM